MLTERFILFGTVDYTRCVGFFPPSSTHLLRFLSSFCLILLQEGCARQAIVTSYKTTMLAERLTGQCMQVEHVYRQLVVYLLVVGFESVYKYVMIIRHCGLPGANYTLRVGIFSFKETGLCLSMVPALLQVSSVVIGLGSQWFLGS